MLSVGRHAKVTVYGKGRGAEGNALESRSKEFQRKIVLLETRVGTSERET